MGRRVGVLVFRVGLLEFDEFAVESVVVRVRDLGPVFDVIELEVSVEFGGELCDSARDGANAASRTAIARCGSARPHMNRSSAA